MQVAFPTLTAIGREAYLRGIAVIGRPVRSGRSATEHPDLHTSRYDLGYGDLGFTGGTSFSAISSGSNRIVISGARSNARDSLDAVALLTRQYRCAGEQSVVRCWAIIFPLPGLLRPRARPCLTGRCRRAPVCPTCCSRPAIRVSLRAYCRWFSPDGSLPARKSPSPMCWRSRHGNGRRHWRPIMRPCDCRDIT